jgi:hypothetical protein
MGSKKQSSTGPALVLSTDDFFSEVVWESFERRNVDRKPLVHRYLVQLLQFFMTTDNLFDVTNEGNGRKTRETLAELFLKASSAESSVRKGLLKKLGDTSLYVSGFFGESLRRKVVDVDYYAELGGTAYNSLAQTTGESELCEVYEEFAERFYIYMDLLTDISQRTRLKSEQDILDLYDRFLTTGSDLAKEQLLEQGVMPVLGSKKVPGQ